MKKILVLLAVLSVSCSKEPSTLEDMMKQKWISTVYCQGWYWSAIYNGGIPSDTLVPFQSDGSFIADIYPWDDTRPDDFPKQRVLLTIDTVVSETEVYYSFPYTFNGEKLTLYRGVAKGVHTATQKPSLYWSSFYNNYKLPDINASNAEKREWLIEYYKKENMNLHQGFTLGLKKNSRSALYNNAGFADYIQGNNLSSSINAVQHK